jgi:predicted permease
MAWFGELWRRLTALLRRKQIDADLEEEMRLHVELRAQQQAEGGVGAEEARYRAQRRFGNSLLWKEAGRDSWGWRWLETLLQDLRYALRMLRRSPGFTAAAVLSLGLGIGANSAIFTLINALLLRMLPVNEPQQLVWLARASLATKQAHSYPYPFYRELREQKSVLSGLLCYSGMSAALNIDGSAERATGELVSGNYFEVLGLKPVIGRVFTAEDEKTPGAGRVAVLSYGYWVRRFGADPAVVGRVIHLNAIPMTVIGVSPRGFDGLDIGQSVDVRVPIVMQAEMWAEKSFLESRNDWWLDLVGRLRPGITREQAQAALQPQYLSYLRTLAEPHPTEYQRRVFASQRIGLDPMARGVQSLGRQFGRALYVLMGVVGAVLLIACVNIANLLLARSAAREREIAIRLAIGAGRGRLMRQMLTESLALAMMGGLLGIGVAYVGTRVLASFLTDAQHLTPSTVIKPDLRVLAFTLALAIVSGILFGLAPALQAVRISVTPELKGGRTAGRAGITLGKLLVSAQVALSVLLLAGAGLFARSLHNLYAMDTGFARENVLVAGIDPALTGYTPERMRQFCRDAIAQVAALPGVRSASYAWINLVAHSGWGSGIKVEGFTPREGDSGPDRNAVGSGYFHTLGIPVLAGRDFGPQDQENSPHVAIVNEKFARFYFGNQNPIGRRIGPLGDDKPTFTIVGVVKNGKYADLREETSRFWYIPYEQLGRTGSLHLFVRSVGRPEKMISTIRGAVQKIDPRVLFDDPKTLEVQIDEDLSTDRLLAMLSAFFSGLAVLLASIGLYGVMAYSVARRTHDIGIRMALGAQRQDVLWMVLRQALLLVVAGIVIGVPLTFAVTRVVSSLLYGLSPSDPVTLSGAVLILFAVAVLASYLPARRASKLDPMTALHYE